MLYTANSQSTYKYCAPPFTNTPQPHSMPSNTSSTNSAITLPTPTYNNPHTPSPADPINTYLNTLAEHLADLQNDVDAMRNVLQQRHERYEDWEKKARLKLQLKRMNEEETAEEMETLYAENLRNSFDGVANDCRAMIRDLREFVGKAEDASRRIQEADSQMTVNE